MFRTLSRGGLWVFSFRRFSSSRSTSSTFANECGECSMSIYGLVRQERVGMCNVVISVLLVPVCTNLSATHHFLHGPGLFGQPNGFRGRHGLHARPEAVSQLTQSGYVSVAHHLQLEISSEKTT